MRIVAFDQLPLVGRSRVFEGDEHAVGISAFIVDATPGDGPTLHQHPYTEVFITLEGQARFVVGDEHATVGPGYVVVVPAGTPHRYTSARRGRFRQIAIHLNARFETEWLDTPEPDPEAPDHEPADQVRHETHDDVETVTQPLSTPRRSRPAKKATRNESTPIDHQPETQQMSETIFQHAGGLEAFRRLTRVFYTKVKLDPMLEPLFGAMSPAHPEHVALWLAEVFGGPADYTKTRGGYPAMVLAHINRAISESQRARWAELLYDSLDEAGLPDDERFRRSFREYIEWGTRIAMRNSETGFTPPRDAHIPLWPWPKDAEP